VFRNEIRNIAFTILGSCGLNHWYQNGIHNRRIADDILLRARPSFKGGLLVSVFYDIAGAANVALCRISRARHVRVSCPRARHDVLDAQLVTFGAVEAPRGDVAGRS
jgi:hypothetical protein